MYVSFWNRLLDARCRRLESRLEKKQDIHIVLVTWLVIKFLVNEPREKWKPHSRKDDYDKSTCCYRSNAATAAIAVVDQALPLFLSLSLSRSGPSLHCVLATIGSCFRILSSKLSLRGKTPWQPGSPVPKGRWSILFWCTRMSSLVKRGIAGESLLLHAALVVDTCSRKYWTKWTRDTRENRLWNTVGTRPAIALCNRRRGP